ncbi:enoyl CoA dehydratase/isomerase [Thermobispora bispora]|jgi:enoyl-CoA hydratase|uniref:Enoyl-CoA hydratase/isomerase n=1 Tax=Thermobispora bispora (strain ATCC 19993 / DSM 43833 / CBS 139.67 / JCM 10125 / KCTC 9307 / NBRC 14880 / R51) TaxID=469371 RepID=D6Y4W9_THEBD|nr:crotonase/enoyl-CoA hydratase family protein [Thermobispora bispora]MBO2475184.1 enoyl-CoA hydratase [Actinomycetales bacterium]MDI9581823.1 crotonase/enoyl-CoA hydratase family protein [Thermobispora sp.]ADG87244.1 Enoyl-CoA hydratase/isomerase [Thermobispora bispora DSM 43833]MBX6166150.1 crotonase/enoyl-CoA hydratase family protein [Thermobispora bispora]QSI47197.1 crotonase/enoyl-CoA hydratase family protein [Thermobispora bispora]
MADEVLVSVDGGVGVITINRPQAKNAVNAAVARGIADAIDDLDARKDVSVLVLTGAGGTFSAGMDLKAFLAGELPMIEGRGFGGITEAPPKKPIIAAVEGYALAGGFELVLSCDLIVASEEAKFGLPEPKRGLVAAAGGVMRLPRRIPYHIAMEIALTGDFYPATRLHELGLVNRITPAGKALEEATELAKKIAANAPLALAATKKIMVESIDWSLDEMFAKQDEITGPVFTSKDAMEGAAAFAEKRAPVWKGE